MITNVRIKKIIAAYNVKNEQALLRNTELQATLYQDDYMTVDEKGGYIIVDFGKEMSGGISISTHFIKNASKSAKIRIRFGESLTECCSEIGRKGATNDHSPRDFNTEISSVSNLHFGNTGYRFVRIDFYPGVEILVKTILGTNIILSKKAEYTYKGKDKKIAKIFAVAKRTVDLCSGGDYIWDGIKRDRLVWIGDLYPEILSLTSMYGPLKVIERSLNFERTRAKQDGIWLSMLNTYNMWWVACLAEYYLRLGDKTKEFVLSQMDFVDENIELFCKYVSEDGCITCPDNTSFFVDWPCSDNRADELVGSRFIYIIAVKKAKLLLEAFGRDTSKAERLLSNLLKGDMTVREKKQVVALKYEALGEITDEEYKMLTRGRAKGLSTFMSYFILTAIASRDKELAISIMKEYYGAMLDKGATTFWEDFSIDWAEGSGRIDKFPKSGEKDIHGDFGDYCYKGFRHSLCHAWSSGVIAFIKENCK